MKTLRRICLLLLIPFSLWAVEKTATTARTALVIGNSNYAQAPLQNPANDATDLGKVLKELGFDVKVLIDADLETMDSAVNEFGRKLEQRGGVGLFFYAGHGIQSKGRNFLIPVGTKLERESDLKYKTFDAGKLIDEMGYAQNNLNIVILDACRDNGGLARSFSRGLARGLARMNDTPSGLLIAYSTAPGQQAEDGDGRNSPYTEELIKAIKQKGRPLEMVFKDVIKGVKKRTKSKQIPWISSSVHGDFYFIEPDKTPKAEVASPKPEQQKQLATTNATESQFELLYWQGIIKNPSIELYQAYIKKYPEGHFIEIAQSRLRQLQKNKDKKAPDEQPLLEQQLVQCQKLLDQYYLTTGPDGDAYSCYTDILKQYPDNIQAKKGIKEITHRYVALIRKRIGQKKYRAANKFLNILESLDNQHPLLPHLKSQLQQEKKVNGVAPELAISEEQQQIYAEYEEVISDFLNKKQLNEKEKKKLRIYLDKMERLKIHQRRTLSYRKKLLGEEKPIVQVKSVKLTSMDTSRAQKEKPKASKIQNPQLMTQAFEELFEITETLVNARRLSYLDHKKIKVNIKKLYRLQPNSKKLHQLKTLYEKRSRTSVFADNSGD